MPGLATRCTLAVAACACLPAAVLAATPTELSAKEKAKGVRTVADALARLRQVQAHQPPLDVRRKIGQEFGECIAGKGQLHSAAVKFLLTGAERDGQKLADSDCLNVASEAGGLDIGEATFPVPVMRSLVANGLLRVDFRNPGPTDFSAVPPLDAASANADGHPVPSAAGAGSAVDKLGECAARVSPEGIRQLALSNAASAGEMDQLRALVPTFAQCLPPGVTLNFAPGLLRDASVLAYARLAYTLAASQTGHGNTG